MPKKNNPGCNCCCVVTYAYTLLGCNSLPLAGVPIAATKFGQAPISATTDASGYATFTTPSTGWTITPQPGGRFGVPTAGGVSGSATCGNTFAETLTYPAGRLSGGTGYGYGCGYGGGYGTGTGYLDSPFYYCVPSCRDPIPPTLVLTSSLGTTCLPQRTSGGGAAGVWGELVEASSGRAPYGMTFARLPGSVTGSAIAFVTPPGGFFCGSAATVTSSEYYSLAPTVSGWKLTKKWFVCSPTAGSPSASSPPVDDRDALRYYDGVGAISNPASYGPTDGGHGQNAVLVNASQAIPYGCSPLALSFTFTQGISTGAVTISESPGQ